MFVLNLNTLISCLEEGLVRFTLWQLCVCITLKTTKVFQMYVSMIKYLLPSTRDQQMA